MIMVPFYKRSNRRIEFLKNIRPEILALAKRPNKLSWSEYKSLTLNSYEQRWIIGNLDNDALCEFANLMISHSNMRELGSFDLPTDSIDMIVRLLAPLLCERLK